MTRCARERERGQREQDTGSAVVKAEMHGGEPFVAHGRDLLTHEDVPGKVEPGLRGQPRQRQQQEQDAEDDAEAVASDAPRERCAVAPYGRDRQSQRQRDAERGHSVDPPRIQVVLVDDARERRHGTERDRRPDEQPRPPGDRSQCDRAEREREVEQHECPPEPAGEVTAAVDVVEQLGPKPRVGDERRRRLGAEESPDEERLP